MKIIAIIGTSIGQAELYNTAKRMGIHTVGFSVPNATNDISHLADEHYNISITEIDRIADICKQIGVNGIVTNGSDFTAKCANEIAFKSGFICNNPESYNKAANKHYVRLLTENLPELGHVNCHIFNGTFPERYPVIIKPQTAGGKVGLSIAYNKDEFDKGISLAREKCNCDILIEDYIDGMKISVEALSSHGSHYVIQTCEAETSGAPHFVEIAHHLPGNIPQEVISKIHHVIPKILDAIKFENGATDIDMKIGEDGTLYLIEVNQRGGGGNLASRLVELSTGYSYIQGQIEIALDEFKKPQIRNGLAAGDYYLCEETANLIPLFRNAIKHDWLKESNLIDKHFENLSKVKTNGDREGYIIYQSDHKITLADI